MTTRNRVPGLALLALFLVGCRGDIDRSEEIARLREAHLREARAWADVVREDPDGMPEEPGLERALRRMEAGVAAGAGRRFETFRTEPFRAGLEELKGLVAEDALAPERERTVEARLREYLAIDPPRREAWWRTYLDEQDRLGRRLDEDPEDGDAIDAWQTLREHLSADPPDLAGLKDVARASDNPRLAESVASILLAAERMPDLHEGLKRDLEAVLLAISVNRYRRAHDGAWPDDLDAIRPDAVPAHPGGGTWALGPDPETDVTSIFLHGGRRFGRAETGVEGFHSGPERPLFRFSEDR